MDRGSSLRLLDAAFEMGIRHFDTASIYGDGLAETWLGYWLRTRRLEGQVSIGTKVGIAAARTWRRAASLWDELEASMRRLSVDRVDQLSLHVFPAQTITALAKDLIRAHRAGRFRKLASTNEPWKAVEALNAALGNSLRIEVVQVQYNLLDRAIESSPEARGYVVEAWSPRGAGLLTAPTRCLPSQWREGRWHERMDLPRVQQLREALQRVADTHAAAIDAVAIAWLCSRGVSPVVGARDVADLERCVAGQHLKLDFDAIQLLESTAPPGRPYEFRFIGQFCPSTYQVVQS